ncbi:MAG: B12-binding domain-containing radical SAM protein [Myxococcota bacterium]
MKRVAFVFPPTGAYCREDRCQSYFAFDLLPSMRPPLEETQGAGAVRAAGGTPWLLDAPAMKLDEAEALDRIVAWTPDVVVATATFGSLEDDLAFLRRLRARLPASVPLGLRGAPCMVFGEQLFEHAVLDFFVRGDPELVFANLVREGLAGAGISTRARVSPAVTASSLDGLPLPDRSVIDASLYRVRGTPWSQATVNVQRGCPFPCSYCLVASVTGKKARHRSPDDVVRELKLLRADGTRFFYLRAETLTLDRRWATELARAISREVPDARWVSATRVDCVDAATLRALAAAGCYGLSFGVETGSHDIGRRVKKEPDPDTTRAAFRACDDAGIASLMYVMLGFLWETPETLAETERFVRAVRPDLLTLYWAAPYPGTSYYDEVKASGLLHSAQQAQASAALEPPGISTATIRRRALTMTARHYARPQVLASLARKLGRNALRFLTP